MKFMIIRAIRLTGLLKFADTCKYYLGRIQARHRNARFASEYPDFPTPSEHLAFDALNHVDWYSYRESGLTHAGIFARAILENTPSNARLSILEWGCGPGRLIRHMPDLLGERAIALTGTDYNIESIEWCRANLPNIRFELNQLNPPLSFPDNSFDVIYNFSVLTHLSEAVQVAWVQELFRVLKPGGLMLCTTHGDAYRYLLASQTEQARYDAGEVVVQGNYAEGKKWFFAIHPEAFVRQKLLVGWKDVRRYPTGEKDKVLQDFWLARKPVSTAS